MIRSKQLAVLGLCGLLLGACSPYAKLYDEVNAAKLSYNPGVNDQKTYNDLKAKLDETQVEAKKSAGKPKPTLAANFVSMTAADAMVNISGIDQTKFAEAQLDSLGYAEQAKSACASGLKSGIDELDGALCALSIATYHLNPSAL